MSFVYHLVPRRMEGSTLLPLNQLKDRWPEIYADAVRKYEGREHILQARVPILNCLWNDVLHLNPIIPSAIAGALREAGDTREFDRRWFKIPIASIAGMPAVALDTGPYARSGRKDYVFADCPTTPFPTAGFEPLRELPAWTRNYYAAKLASGEHPLLFNGCLHVLVKATIPVADVDTVPWGSD